MVVKSKTKLIPPEWLKFYMKEIRKYADRGEFLAGMFELNPKLTQNQLDLLVKIRENNVTADVFDGICSGTYFKEDVRDAFITLVYEDEYIYEAIMHMNRIFVEHDPSHLSVYEDEKPAESDSEIDEVEIITFDEFLEIVNTSKDYQYILLNDGRKIKIKGN